MRFLTSGESHGKGLSVLIDDFPAGVTIQLDALQHELWRRQQGYGRGGRMKIETDHVEIISGVRFQKTTGAPISLWIENRDYRNWLEVMAIDGEAGEAALEKKFIRPRPGHADLAGYYKYNHQDLRDVLERSSARETAARVAAGGIAKALLSALGIELFSHVTQLGGVTVPEAERTGSAAELKARAEGNDLRSVGTEQTLTAMRQRVDQALKEGSTLGGDIEIVITGLPPGLGSYAQWDRRLDGQFAQALMSIQAVKSVSIGAGDQGGTVSGHQFHDAITKQDNDSLTRPTNRAGGLEGGVTNGMPVVLKAVMKPIATMRTPLESINLETGDSESAHFERSDVTAVPACGVICEAMAAIVLVSAIQDKLGRDCLGDMLLAKEQYINRLHPKPVVY